jgi:hypothetical protein
MIDSSFIEKIEELSKVEIKEIGGLSYSTKKLNLIHKPIVQTIDACTLTGFVDFAIDLDKVDVFIHVSAYDKVFLFSDLAINNSREIFIQSIVHPRRHRFNNFVAIEEFIIWLLSSFVQTPERDSVIEFVSSIKHEFVKENVDNGLNQSVAVRSGIAKISEKPMPSPVKLKPFRTFNEIDQPESLFILRAKKIGDEIHLMLAEADGGAWENDAILSIRDYLMEKLPDFSVIA